MGYLVSELQSFLIWYTYNQYRCKRPGLDLSPQATPIARRAEVPQQSRVCDVWHDRAVFHFFTTVEQRNAYVRSVAKSVRRGGHVIIGTFGPEDPSRWSGLDVVRYNAHSLHHEFGKSFRLVESSEELHQAPFGTTQQFLYCYCQI